MNKLENNKLIKCYQNMMRDFYKMLREQEGFIWNMEILYKEGSKYFSPSDEELELDPIPDDYYIRTVFQYGNVKIVLFFAGQDHGLESLIYFGDIDEDEGYTVYGLLDLLDEQDFKVYTFRLLFTEGKLKIGVAKLKKLYKKLLPGILKISEDKEQISRLKEIAEKDNQAVLKRGKRMNSVLNYCHKSFVNNKYKKAIPVMKKNYDLLTIYEKRLCDFMEKQEADGNEKEYISIEKDLDADSIISINTNRGLIDMISVFISWPIAAAIITIPYVLVYILYYRNISSAIYVLKSDIVFTFMPGIIYGIFAAVILKKPILKFLLKGKYEEYMEVQRAQRSRLQNNILKWIFGILFAASIVFMYLMLRWNIIFYNGGFTDNSKFINPKREFIKYEQVEAVYRVQKYRNSYDKLVNEPSHAIKLKDGSVIDMRGLELYDEFDEKGIPIFKHKNIPVVNIKFIEEIKNK